MKVKAIEKGKEIDFRRIDRVITFSAVSSFVSGGLTYFKTDRYNYKVIATEDIISIE